MAQIAAAAIQAGPGSGPAGAAAAPAANARGRAAPGEIADCGHVLRLAVARRRAVCSPGDHVEKGQVIGIIEAMKLMNEIEADVSGEVVKCLVSNGQAIEFGQPLFSIRPV